MFWNIAKHNPTTNLAINFGPIFETVSAITTHRDVVTPCVNISNAVHAMSLRFFRLSTFFAGFTGGILGGGKRKLLGSSISFGQQSYNA